MCRPDHGGRIRLGCSATPRSSSRRSDAVRGRCMQSRSVPEKDPQIGAAGRSVAVEVAGSGGAAPLAEQKAKVAAVDNAVAIEVGRLCEPVKEGLGPREGASAALGARDASGEIV